MRKVLLDTNLLIGAFDSEPGNEMHEQAKSKLRALLQDNEVNIALSSLVLYEVLRGVRNTSLEELDRRLKPFQIWKSARKTLEELQKSIDWLHSKTKN